MKKFSIFYWTTAGAITALAAHFGTRQPDLLLNVAILALLFLILYRKIENGLHIIILLPVVGELLRVPAGPAGNVLISDIFIPFFLTIFAIKFFCTPNTNKFVSPPLTWPVLLFVSASILSLIHSLTFLSASETISGSFYLIRFIEYALVYFSAYLIIKNHRQPAKIAKKLFTSVIISALLLAIAGFVQLIIYPDLGNLQELGWDPHINRLVSTWLDPNFLGGFLAFIITILTSLFLHYKNLRFKGLFMVLITMLGMALFLTYSRSAYLALAVGLFIVGILKSRTTLVIFLILFLIGISISDRARQRVSELAQRVISVITVRAENPDPTARLRIQSWHQATSLIYKRPFFGSGYNTLRFVNYNEGFVENTGIHSASGSDSSLLTILATTGIIGFMPFITIYILLIIGAFKNWSALEKKRKSEYKPHIQNKPPQNEFETGFSLGITGAIFSLLTHSFFVNSLLFPQILVFFWICSAISENLTRLKSPKDDPIADNQLSDIRSREIG